MLRHALKLVWNRRRANALVAIEIAAAFVVTFVLVGIAFDLWTNYRRPLGFDYRDVWSVAVTRDASDGFTFFTAQNDTIAETVRDVTAALRALPATLDVEPISLTPFVGYIWNTGVGPDEENPVLTNMNRTTTEGLQSIGVSLLEGRWFEPRDEGQTYRAALVNRTFVERAFGPDEDPVGRQISFPDPNAPLEQVPEWQAAEAMREIRVIGVIDDFRQWGEFVEPRPYLIQQFEESDARGASFNLAVKVRPGTAAGFEEDIIRTVESVAAGWTAAVAPWEQLRAATHANTLLPLKIATTVAVFFLALVVMGLIGVVWQDVVRRTQEIGLRRALGATAATVRRQIQIEMLAVGGFGIAFGVVIAMQFPLLEIVDSIDWAATIPSLLLSAAMISALVFVGALYPGWLASRREPADALRYE